jgi:hypothetical protein
VVDEEMAVMTEPHQILNLIVSMIFVKMMNGQKPHIIKLALFTYLRSATPKQPISIRAFSAFPIPVVRTDKLSIPPNCLA